jgi:hypothetical protein
VGELSLAVALDLILGVVAEAKRVETARQIGARVTPEIK